MAEIEPKHGSGIRVGIPRAFLYYQYYPMWRTFFEALEAEVVVSPPTTTKTMQVNYRYLPTDTCMPAKVFRGHVSSLVGECDVVFAPAIHRLERGVPNCAKFLGLPDMTKAVLRKCPPILSIDIDANKGKWGLYNSIYSLGRRFTRNPLRIREAGLAAWQAHIDYQKLMTDEKLTIPQALKRLYPEDMEARDSWIVADNNSSSDFDLTIAVIGHPYVVHDGFMNNGVKALLNKGGARIVTSEMVCADELDKGIRKLVGRPNWTYEREIVGAVAHFLESPEVDGVIGLKPFGCGPDSVMVDIVQDYIKESSKKPLQVLGIDEHTAKAGLKTRVEAILDTLRNQRQRGKILLPL